MELQIDKIVYFCFTEQFWDKPYPIRRSDVYDTRSVILKGKIIGFESSQFKALLLDNNGFERDGEEYVFDNGLLLSNQNFTDFESLGKWKKQ